MKNFRELVDEARKRYPYLDRCLNEGEAIGRWELAVGSHIAKHARAVTVVHCILYVEVDHSIWKQEINYLKHRILPILNGLAPGARSLLPPPKQIIHDLNCFEKKHRPPGILEFLPTD